MIRDYRIHGDNIVECERALELISRALRIPYDNEWLPVGSPLTPTYSLTPTNSIDTFRFTFFPGYGRWDVDILNVVRSRGGRLREAPDAIVCRFDDGREVPLFAIEFSGALPAGNQAWQRSGRALSFAHASIPYIYIAELSGFELNSDRDRKAERLPNPAVPFSYLLLAEEVKSPTVPIFVRSPGASEKAVDAHSSFYGDEELVETIRLSILGLPTDVPVKELNSRALGLVSYLARNRKGKKNTLSPEQWGEAYQANVRGDTLPSYLVREAPIAWKKTAYIAGLTSTARELMDLTAKFARGLTSSSLPMCVVASRDRNNYAEALAKLYPQAKSSFLEWCRHDGHLAICWVMGFKPRGDDARPDRGLPPLCRMLVGENTELLTVVYGPAPKDTWPKLEHHPVELMKQNGLWEACMTCSDALLIDSSTLPTKPPLTYLKNQWTAALPPVVHKNFAVTPAPLRVGENDVDTVIHLLFSRLGYPKVFEGLCNPPGGDWSGLSLLTEDRQLEHRWLTLPRVTEKDAKRPDHVFQIFGTFVPSLILAIESKERPESVERGIGPRLLNYVSALTSSEPSVQREPNLKWNHYSGPNSRPELVPASAAAFVASNRGQLGNVAATANVDIVLGFNFPQHHNACACWVLCCTPVGRLVGDFMLTLPLGGLDLVVEVQS